MTSIAAERSPSERSLYEQYPRITRNGDRPDLRELERLRTRARRFADEHVRPRALESDRRTGEDPSWFDWDLVRAGADAGMLSFLIPKPAGGAGGLATQAAVVMEELCDACPGIALIFGAHALGISPLLLGGPSQWDGVLAELIASERTSQPQLMACAITEPEAGTDVEDPDLLRRARITSHARRVPGGFRLNGAKRFISNGSVARWITLLMPTDPRRPAETWTCFLLDTRSEGFTVSRVEHKMGQRACPAAELTFDEVFVPDERVVGREGDGAPTSACWTGYRRTRPPGACSSASMSSSRWRAWRRRSTSRASSTWTPPPSSTTRRSEVSPPTPPCGPSHTCRRASAGGRRGTVGWPQPALATRRPRSFPAPRASEPSRARSRSPRWRRHMAATWRCWSPAPRSSSSASARARSGRSSRSCGATPS